MFDFQHMRSMISPMNKIILSLLALCLPQLSFAQTASPTAFSLQATNSTFGILALALFILAYAFVMAEDIIQLRKSKPVVFAAGVIWLFVAYIAQQKGQSTQMLSALEAYILDYAELLLFIFVAMTYINVLTDRHVFALLRVWLIRRGFSYRQLFWITGLLAFCLSPIADNLTTALIMGAVVIALGQDNPRFVLLGCINVVVAANAGGAFTPFGDITTLMVWQSGVLPFLSFFKIFLPSLISYLVPAVVMSLTLPYGVPTADEEKVTLKPGAIIATFLFLATIATAICVHNYLHLPPMIGMMLGLAYLQFLAFGLQRREKRLSHRHYVLAPFNIFHHMERIEWDTLLFFYGVILGIGGLATFGYLEWTSQILYYNLGQSLPSIYQAAPANTIAGLLSAILGNIPIMFTILTMKPPMAEGQWLLVTLTAGIGGSLLSIGSAAGVALMGQARGVYTFMSHLKWTWVIALGYFAAIGVHLWLNARTF